MRSFVVFFAIVALSVAHEARHSERTIIKERPTKTVIYPPPHHHHHHKPESYGFCFRTSTPPTVTSLPSPHWHHRPSYDKVYHDGKITEYDTEYERRYYDKPGRVEYVDEHPHYEVRGRGGPKRPIVNNRQVIQQEINVEDHDKTYIYGC